MSTIRVEVEPHPLLRVAAFTTTFPAPLGALSTPLSASDALRLDATGPLERNEETRAAVRDMLRHGGYKPTGRGKPASEYLVRAASEGGLGSINAAVDACNAVSLHSGFPISVVDLDRADGPFRIAIAPEGASYVFNASGQEIDLAGLLCLFDSAGPCANAVRDAQRDLGLRRVRGAPRKDGAVVPRAARPGRRDDGTCASDRGRGVTAATRLTPPVGRSYLIVTYRSNRATSSLSTYLPISRRN